MKMRTIPETYGEALAMGWTNGVVAMYRGYTSRRVDIYAQPVLEVGGSRKGCYYVELPNYTSTIYGTYRQYILPPKNNA